MKITYHRDHTVTVWNCLAQCWLVRVAHVPHAVLATLSPKDRERIVRHTSGARRHECESTHFRTF